jgi:mandelate racemase
MPDFMRIGGVSGWLKAAAIAGGSWHPDVHAPLPRGGRARDARHRNRALVEWQDWADPVLQKPYEISDGMLHIPDVPGVGIEWDEEAVMANEADL